MSEYSRAPGRGHRVPAGKRAMQVDRQPSPWPCVAMLALLLLFCLMAPRYWRNAQPPEVATIGGTNDVANNPANISSQSNLAGSSFGLSDGTIHLDGPPTIEELIAQRTAAAQFGNRADQWQTDQWPVLETIVGGPVLEPTASNEPVMDEDTAQAISTAMQMVGATLADSSNQNWTSRLIGWTIDKLPGLYDRLLNENETVATNELRRIHVRVEDSTDRLAMLPEPREMPIAHPWCVPQMLYEQLDRLAGQPESAQWASHVRNQLHAVTDRDQLQGEDVQGILSDLSESATEALRMADTTQNDRLRVELLRAHWALARRLDCWGAMHEQRVALHSQERVAARGDLGPYLNGSTPEAASEATEISAISKELENYEKGRDPKIARQVAQEQQKLKASTNTVDRTLADAVEQHYRNANIRVAVTAELINRLIGKERVETKPVHGQLAGTFVQGQSNVRSQSHVLLDPSADDWQLELRANGVVESNTIANGGPVQFRSRGTTDFSARKTVVIDDKGVRLKESLAEAKSRNRLVGVTTDYDWVPLVGDYARERAVNEYWSRQGRVQSQMESRVTSQARDTIDEQTREMIQDLRKQTYDRIASQLDPFDIKLTPVEMKTTPDRLVARIRVAGDNQLGSHTPRPRALSDSLASLQIHETALTNLAVTLGLDGKRYTAPELRNMLREKFPQLATKNPTEARPDTIFEFAKQDSVQVHIDKGRLELTVAFTSIVLRDEEMRNVIVHAYYVPAIDGLNAELVRDGVLGIEGRFSAGERAQLHNIFNRVLPQERHLPIVKAEDFNDKRFEGLMITQLVLEDGWAGLAVGPTTQERVAERSRSLK